MTECQMRIKVKVFKMPGFVAVQVENAAGLELLLLIFYESKIGERKLKPTTLVVFHLLLDEVLQEIIQEDVLCLKQECN